MSEPIAPEFLRTLAFLSPLTDDEAHKLAAHARSEEYAAGAVLFREGDRLHHFCIAVAGQVAIEILGPDRRLRRIQTVGAGELLGWSPVLGPGEMTATARALTNVRVVAFDARAVVAVCEADPQFGYLFMKRVAAAIASRLNATRLQLIDMFGGEIPAIPAEGGSA